MDVEFKKPYEYEDEKRGFPLLLFVVMITIVDIFDTVTSSIRVYNIFKHIIALGICCIMISILFLFFLIYTAITCYKLKKNMITVAKRYLITRTVFLISCVTIVFINKVNNSNLIGDEVNQYKTVNQMVFWELIIPLIPIILLSVIWYVYFINSKKCKEILSHK